MTLHVAPLTDLAESADLHTDAGLGALGTERGNLPLERIEATVAITGLVSRMELTQGFRNPFDVPLEATYVFPLPDRAAVTAMRMTADGRVVDAELKERGQARQEYDQAIAEGKRASIAEEERPDVFTMRVGNILPGERVSVALTLVGPLSYEDGEATFRLPLVVAPRFIPGVPIGGPGVGDGYGVDTDAVPDASRITPPVLLPGFPNPVRLSIVVDVDPAGLPLGAVRSSLHTIVEEGNRIRIQPGERANRDFILRLSYGEAEAASSTLTVTPDAEGAEGTFRLTVLPPTTAAPPRPRDVVLLLDRSGSMQGWKMVAARRAAARIVDTLTASDRFAVLAFDNVVEAPPSLGDGLVDATDRHRFRAVEHLSRMDARGGTVLLAPLTTGLGLLTDAGRDRVLVLVTDGQVGNEDQILAAVAGMVAGVRVHAVGIDQAVNAGFLGRLAAAGGGRCELVESEDRLDDAMDRIHRRIGAPVVAGLGLTPQKSIVDGTVSPARLPDLFPGAPLVLTGRYRGTLGAVHLAGRTRAGADWSVSVDPVTAPEPALTSSWARSYLRDLEDRFAGTGGDELEQQITAASLRFGVLCRFTAWLAVDTRVVAGEPAHRVIQPVEAPAGWDNVGGVPRYFLAAAASGGTLAAAAPAGLPMAAPMPQAPSPAVDYAVAPARSRASAKMAASAGSTWAREEERADRDAPDDIRAFVLAQATTEAARLRAAADLPGYERRELLADLGTRLPVLFSQLVRVPGVAAEQYRALVTDCAGDRPLGLPEDEFEELWARTLRLLEDLAGTVGAGPHGQAGDEPDGGTGRSGGFWRRRPAQS